MAAQVAKERSGHKIGPDVVRVGKDVIELVTSGMYVLPVTIFREYVQNAADSIDDARDAGLLGRDEQGKVSIHVDHVARTVVIRDNGCGIPEEEAVATLLAIGGSSKRGTRARGFRGVGRLSGLAYCQELEFRTKAAGDALVLSVLWDCRRLRSRLADGAFKGDIRQIICECTEVWYETASNADEHYFEVRLRNVSRHRQDMLLNEKTISRYLAQVAPVRFSEHFSHGSAIEDWLCKHAPRMPIELTINGVPIVRLFQDRANVLGSPHQLTINEIEFLEFADVDGEVGAVGWLGHHDYIRSISTNLGIRGLRARIGDIQIGEATLFDESFKEARFNGWAIGEIHVVDPRIIPNARRDNFELNNHAYNLIMQINPIAAQIAKRCRAASMARNSSIMIGNTIEQVAKRLTDSTPVTPAEASKSLASIERCRQKLKAVCPADSAVLAAQLDELRRQLSATPLSEHAGVVALDEALALVAKYVTNREQANRLSDALRTIRG